MKIFTAKFQLLGELGPNKVQVIAERQEDLINFLVKTFYMDQAEVDSIQVIAVTEHPMVLLYVDGVWIERPIA